MQEEVEQRTVTLAINTTKMSANVLKSAIAKYLAYRKEKAREGPVKPCGKQSVKPQHMGPCANHRAGAALRDPSASSLLLGRLSYSVKPQCLNPRGCFHF